MDAEIRAARLADLQHLVAFGSKSVSQKLRLRAFSGSLAALKRDKQSHAYTPEMETQRRGSRPVL